jgi:hypothetical protein
MTILLPSETEEKGIIEAINASLKSFCYHDPHTNALRPIICCVCDAIASSEHWANFVPVSDAKTLFRRANMMKSNLPGGYPSDLIDQYTARIGSSIHNELKDFVLSPETIVSSENQILICKDCIKELESISKSKGKRRQKRYPQNAICNFNLVGDAPSVLENLNDIELSLVSVARVECQSWVFFGGCHRQIRGWHTLYRNRPVSNVGNLMQISDAGLKGTILVVLCNAFTKKQHLKLLERTAVNPEKCVTALRWLIQNNYKYANFVLPDINDIPVPKVVYSDL